MPVELGSDVAGVIGEIANHQARRVCQGTRSKRVCLYIAIESDCARPCDIIPGQGKMMPCASRYIASKRKILIHSPTTQTNIAIAFQYCTMGAYIRKHISGQRIRLKPIGDRPGIPVIDIGFNTRTKIYKGSLRSNIHPELDRVAREADVRIIWDVRLKQGGFKICTGRRQGAVQGPHRIGRIVIKIVAVRQRCRMGAHAGSQSQ